MAGHRGEQQGGCHSMAFQIPAHTEASAQAVLAVSWGPRRGRSHGLHGAWCRGRVHEGRLQLMSLSEKPAPTTPPAEGRRAGPLGPSLLLPIWLTRPFTSHHFTHFVIFLVSFIFSSFLLYHHYLLKYSLVFLNATHIFVVIVWRALNTCIYQKGI